VQGEGEIGTKLCKGGIGNHRPRPGAGFLGRLEQHNHPSAYRPAGGDRTGKAGDNRHMPVMSAQMSPVIHLRPPGDGRDFTDQQAIEFAAEQNRRSRLPAVEDRGHAMAAKPGDQLVGLQRRHLLSDPRRGAAFFS